MRTDASRDSYCAQSFAVWRENIMTGQQSLYCLCTGDTFRILSTSLTSVSIFSVRCCSRFVSLWAEGTSGPCSSAYSLLLEISNKFFFFFFYLIIFCFPRATKYVYIKSNTVYVPSSDLGLSHPLSRQRVCPSTQNRGGGHTRLRVRGWGSSNFDDWRKA